MPQDRPVEKVVKDPDFLKLSKEAQAIVMSEMDKDFAGLSEDSKIRVIDQLVPQRSKEKSDSDPWREAAILGGSTVGALAGLPGGVPGSIIGAGLGGAGAEGLYQVGQQAFGDPNRPKSSLEAAKRIGGIGAREGALEAVGGGVMRAGQKALAPFRKTVLPEARAVISKFKDRIKPIVLTPAEATESKTLDVLQNISEGSILGGGKFAKFKKYRNVVFEDIADDIIQQFGSRVQPDEVGELFVDAITKKNESFKAVSNILYNNVDELAEDAVITTGSMKKFVEPIAEVGESLGGIEAVNSGDDLVKAVIDLPDNLSYFEAKELRTRLLSRVNEFNVLNKKAPAIGKAKKIIGLLDNAIEKGLPKDAQQAWRTANQFYREGQERFNNTMIRRLMKHAEDTGMGPEMIAKNVFKPGNFTLIKTVKGALKPKEWTKMQNWYVQDLFKKSIGGAGEISGQKLLNNMYYKPTGMGDKALKEIFSPEQLKGITDFGQTLKLVQEKQGEGLGKMWIQLAQGSAVVGLGAGLAYDQDALKGSSAAIVLGPAVLSGLLMKPSVARLLTTGIKTPASSPQIAGLTTRLLGAYWREKHANEERE